VCAGFKFCPSPIRWPSAPHRAACRPVVPLAPLAPPHRICARLAPPRRHARPRLRHSPSAIATGLLGVPSHGFAIAHFVGHGLRSVGRSAIAPRNFARPQVADTAAAMQGGQDAPLAARLRSTHGKASVRGWPLTELKMRYRARRGQVLLRPTSSYAPARAQVAAQVQSRTPPHRMPTRIPQESPRGSSTPCVWLAGGGERMTPHPWWSKIVVDN